MCVVTPIDWRMTETRTSCTKCNNPISTRTAEKNGGLCAICTREANRPKNWEQLRALPSDTIEFDVRLNTSSLVSENNVQWKAVEDLLVDLASQYLRLFADANLGKQFYGVAFDCNADMGQVFFCANSPEGLTDRAVECKMKSPDLYNNMSLNELQNVLRWSLGDWEFNAMTTDSFSASWESVTNNLAYEIDWKSHEGIEKFRANFMGTACRAMLRLEVNGILDLLSQTDDFRSFVANHDETEDDSWGRYNAYRERQGLG